MTYIPHGPLWCWMVQGPDAVFASQPTQTYLSGEYRVFTDRAGCVARCQHTDQFLLEKEPLRLTFPVQCGTVAGVDLHGRYLCDYHLHCHWECDSCDAFLPEGTGGYCSEACREAVEEVGLD